MVKRYRNSPIVEALCEFQFDTDTPWDLTLPGLIYDKLKFSFPNKEQLPLNLAMAITSGLNDQPGNSLLLPLMRFLDYEENKLFQLGQNLLTINHLNPYTSWEVFSSLIESVFKTYLEVAKPKSLRHFAMKYINHIEISSLDHNLEHLFHFRPLIPHSLSGNLGPFLIGVNLPYEHSQGTLRLQLGTIDADDVHEIGLRLEITYVFTKPDEIPFENVLREAHMAHQHIASAFEACITDELKNIFGKEEV